MKPSSFHSAASNLAEEATAALPAQAAAFTDPAQAYDPAFIELAAAAHDDLLFSLKQTLRQLKGFQVREFERRIKAARLKFHASPNGATRVNGHAANGWRELLIKNEKGSTKPLLANAITALRLAPEWSGVLSYNELSCRIIKLKQPPFTPSTTGNWTDEDDILTAEWLQRNHIEVGINAAAAAAQAIAHERTFHPVRDYLTTLKWDGEPRISRWLTTYLGVEWSEYSSQVGSKWLISAVARIMRPGCQVDTCLVLEGEQGIRKSSALRLLAGDDWFTDQISDLSNKDSSQDLNGKWIVEFSDLGQMSRAEAGVLKAFLSRRIDHYRQSYGRRTQDFPRQCIFAASTNKDNWAGDETGARRFWPIRCGAIDIAALAHDRDQLWAEALSLFSDGANWWLEDSAVITAATEEQSARFETDAWDHKVWNWILEQEKNYDIDEEARYRFRDPPTQIPYSVSHEDILEKCLSLKPERWGGSEKYRISKILTFHGFQRWSVPYVDQNGYVALDDDRKRKFAKRYRRKPVKGT